MKASPCESLGSVALRTLEYLRTHPSAQETLEGIAEWWLLEQRIRIVVGEVKEALAELAAKRLVVELRRADGRMYYRLNKRKRRTVERLLRERALSGGQRD